MYCPRCAAQNLDDAKFCRGCGNSLETVALALSGHYDKIKHSSNPSETWLYKRSQAMRSLVKAGGWLGSSLIIGTALGLFGPNDWVVIWLVFAGWMAVLGMFSLVAGINGLIDSRFMQRQLDQAGEGRTLAAHERAAITDGLATPPLLPHGSVTEHTTKHLTKPPVT